MMLKVSMPVIIGTCPSGRTQAGQAENWFFFLVAHELAHTISSSGYQDLL